MRRIIGWLWGAIGVIALVWGGWANPTVADAACDPDAPLIRLPDRYENHFISSSGPVPAISTDGRFVTFSEALLGETPEEASPAQIFIYDRLHCTLELISRSSSGALGTDSSYRSAVSDTGRYVAFISYADNLIPDDTNERVDVFIHDQRTGITRGTSFSGDYFIYLPLVIAAMEPYVVFELSQWAWLGPGHGVYRRYIYGFDALTNETTLITKSPDGMFANGDSGYTNNAISLDGRYVVFSSTATNLMNPPVPNDNSQLYVYDRFADEVRMISIAPDGTTGNGWSWYGMFQNDNSILFRSSATNLVPNIGTQNGFFLYSFEDNTISFRPATLYSGQMSDDGRYTGFIAQNNLTPSDTNLCLNYPINTYINHCADAYVFDHRENELHRISVSAEGIQPDREVMDIAFSGNGEYMAFVTYSANLTGETHIYTPLYLRRTNIQDEPINLIQNAEFFEHTPLQAWSIYGAPGTVDKNVEYRLQPYPDFPVFQMDFFRRVRPGIENSAVVLQQTGESLPRLAPLELVFDTGNSSGVRKRLGVLIHDADFSDLQFCSFWLPPNQPLQRYRMVTQTHEAWSNATLSFYAATADETGWYQLDNVSLRQNPAVDGTSTICTDPNTPADLE